jgi:dTDP-4-dehydrorhamnose 3,5-epimerase
MRIVETKLDGVVIVEPDVFGDNRGFFMELYNRKRYADLGIVTEFVQDNVSLSAKGILRGLHYQLRRPQAKLVHVLKGKVSDVAVDIRVGSPTFGQWVGEILSDENKRQMFVPEGFAHGFCVISDSVLFHYKCSDFYDPGDEYGVLWSDNDLGIQWPVGDPVLSEKDKRYSRLGEMPAANLPVYIK